MARSIKSFKLVSSLVVDGVSSVIARCGFAAAAIEGGAASGSVRAGGARGGASQALKRAGEEKLKSAEKVSWGPDPKTGYYRPESASVEVDVAELRAALLKHGH